ncbi:MAG: ATP-binding protein [Spirochaetia bacterium]|jgi:signal transduction histidine kinase
MRLRTKLLIGILVTLLLQMAVTGTFTLRTLLFSTRNSTEADLQGDWDRARAYIEELKHQLFTNLYQLTFFVQQDQAAMASAASLRAMMRYFISLTNADRIVLIDDPGVIVADERVGIGDPRDELPAAFLNPRDFAFPRSEFISVSGVNGAIRLYLVTGTSFARKAGGMRHLYLVTDVDKSMVEAIWEKTATEVAFFVGTTPVVSASPWQPFETEAPLRTRVIRLGGASYSVFSRTLSADVPEKIYLVAFRSLLAQELYVRSVLLSYLTAFLVTLVASLFLAAGFTSLTISPFTRLSQWLHRYMDSGEVGKLDIRSRDEIGFLAGAFHGMVSTLIDEKRVIGEQLEQISVLNAYNQRIMNDIPAGIIVTGPEGAIEFCNGYFADLVRCGVEQLKGMLLRELMERCFTLRSGDPAGSAFILDGDTVVEGLKLDRPDGQSMHFTAKASSISLGGGRRGSLVVLEDVTPSERFWSKMAIADKVTSLGILSAGMAHEINNPLGTIISHVNYLKAVEREGDKRDSLDWIERETNRIADIIKRILVYSAPGARRDTHADLNQVAAETVEVLRFTLEKKKLSLAMSLSDGMPTVVCPSDELKQVVLNILLNACEACPERGAIRLSTERDPGGRATLSVSDNGVGIDPADMKNIFDPFFTTKLATQGNGLGLSICYAIVKRTGGEIRVSSIPGGGTNVEVMLRVHEHSHH